MIQSVSDGEYREIELGNNVKYLKNDMDRITKDLELIRDLVLQAPEAKDNFKSLFKDSNIQESDQKPLRELEETLEMFEEIEGEGIGEGEFDIDEEDYELPEYNSREISDIINNDINISPRKFK